MVLHDSFFFSVDEQINETVSRPIAVSHSPLFYSTWTLLISSIGCITNSIGLIRLICLMHKHRRRRQKPSDNANRTAKHFLSHQKYRFLFILLGNNLALAFLSLISCFNERFFYQSLIAHLRLCSVYIFLWKFTLHFLPLVTIFLLLRYHYKVHQHFPVKTAFSSTASQLFCTDLCILIPFVLALAWSVDGLWLWGETRMKDFKPSSSMSSGPDTNNALIDRHYLLELKRIYQATFHRSDQEFICYLRINKNFNFTARLLYLVQMDYVLLFSLHAFGLLLEIVLHVRLSCCLATQKITSFFLREHQLALYILYLLICFTVTSLPFYFHRASEILFDWQIFSSQGDLTTSSTFAQILLAGISLQPVLFALLFLPAKFLFRLRCYTSIRLLPQSPNMLFDMHHPLSRMHSSRSSLQLDPVQPKLPVRTRMLSAPIAISNTNSSFNCTLLTAIAEDSNYAGTHEQPDL